MHFSFLKQTKSISDEMYILNGYESRWKIQFSRKKQFMKLRDRKLNDSKLITMIKDLAFNV